VAAVAVLAACSQTSAAKSTGTSARDQSLVIAENEPPASFDPIQADNSTVDEVDLPAYDTLITYNKSIKLVGSLAKSWSVSSDGKTVKFVLRSGVTFHDGTKLTATDVKYTLDRVKAINIGVASLLSAYSSSTVTDATHLTIKLSSADATFVPSLVRLYIVNAALVQKHLGKDNGQSWLATHDAGSGPYELKSYTSNQSATFTQYPKYWGGFSGQAKTVVFNYLSGGPAEEAALKSGDVDIAMDIDPSDWSTLAKQGYTVQKDSTNVVLYAFFNMDGAATKNVALREAIAYAYNYNQHVTSILKGAGKTVTGPMPSTMQCAATAGVAQPTYDLAKAKQIVAANHLAGTTVTMTYLQATSEMEQAAALLQSSLAQIGITLKLDSVTYPAYATLASNPSTRPDIGMIYAFPAIPDASAILYQNYDSKFIGAGQNWSGFSDPQVDSLLAAAQTSTSQATRCADYTKVQDIVSKQYVAINMANSKYVTVYDSRVKGYTYQSWHHQTVDVYAITLKNK
jgi:peptide/nickel transport system substrate-binding protein